jgi:hypothetical protein
VHQTVLEDQFQGFTDPALIKTLKRVSERQSFVADLADEFADVRRTPPFMVHGASMSHSRVSAFLISPTFKGDQSVGFKPMNLCGLWYAEIEFPWGWVFTFVPIFERRIPFRLSQ